jgi:hypothetical protein
MRYLATIPVFFAESRPIMNAKECEPFWDMYEAIPRPMTMAYEEKGISDVSRRGRAVAIMLSRLKVLHENGFAHGDIHLWDFGSIEGHILTARTGEFREDLIKLGNLINIESVFDEDWQMNLEGAISMKRDLLDFKIILFLYPKSNIFWKFLKNVEIIKVDDFYFDYNGWIKQFNYMSKRSLKDMTHSQ